MRFIPKTSTFGILAIGLIAVAGCDSTVQAQTTQTATAVHTAQTETAVLSVAAPEVKIWQMNAEESYLKFTALQEGEPFEGGFSNFTADIKFHPDNLAASSVTVTVPMSGVDAGSTDRNSTLPGKAWFSAKKFPDAVFTANIFKPMGEGVYEAAGELTIKGNSVPLSLPFTLDVDGETAVMMSTLKMNRNDWNVGTKPWNTDEWVSTEVTLDIVVTAVVAP